MSARRASGQAVVELLALAPLVIAVAVAAAQLLAAGLCAELAGHAAEAGAAGILQGRDPRRAAADALPGWSRGGLRVQVHGRRVTVRLTAPGIVPGAAGRLAADAQADAGPAA